MLHIENYIVDSNKKTSGFNFQKEKKIQKNVPRGTLGRR